MSNCSLPHGAKILLSLLPWEISSKVQNGLPSALYSPALRSLLAGDLAVINDQQVITTDTRVDLPEAAFLPTAQPGLGPTPFSGEIPPVTINRPTWILPALGVSLGLITLILLFVFYNVYAQNRRRSERSNYKAQELKNKKTTKENE